MGAGACHQALAFAVPSAWSALPQPWSPRGSSGLCLKVISPAGEPLTFLSIWKTITALGRLYFYSLNE